MTGFRGKSCKNTGAREIAVICQIEFLTYPPQFTDIIPERAETLARAQIVGDRLVLSYLKDAASMAMMTDLNGKPVQQIALNSIGTASGFGGTPGDPETFYSFSSFNQPGAIYRFDSRTGKSTPFALPKLSFKPEDIAVSQIFYPSAKTALRSRCSSSTKRGSTCRKARRRSFMAMAGSTFRRCRGIARRGWRGFNQAASLRSPTCAAAANMESRGMMRGAC